MVFCWAWSKVWTCVACEQILIIGARPELFFAREKFLGEAVRDLKSLALKMNAWLPANLHLTLLKSSHEQRNARPATLTKLINHQRLFCAIFLKVFEVSSPIFLQILLFGAISMYSSVRWLGAIYQHCTCLCSCFLHYFVGWYGLNVRFLPRSLSM